MALYPDLAYKPDVDFKPIGMVAGLPIVITAKKELPANDLKEFILYVKANAERGMSRMPASARLHTPLASCSIRSSASLHRCRACHEDRARRCSTAGRTRPAVGMCSWQDVLLGKRARSSG